MSAERFARMATLFAAACRIPPDERPAFLDTVCGGDAELRGELEALLAHDEQPHRLLDTPATSPRGASARDPEPLVPADDVIPDAVGHYRILGVLGAGGMGTVYRAEQSAPRRTVALKVIRAGLVSRNALRRFEREASVLAVLQHPGIAQIYEAGTAEVHGRIQPFFALEFVDGRSITRWANEHDATTRDRLALLAQVCDAVQHAHERGIVHRDLKPANILVDATGRPKVLDFGVARATRPELASTSMMTQLGQVIGTVPYMSPEQVEGASDDVDERSDVYALGVIGYELLARRLPYEVAGRSLVEAARMVCDEPPTPLSAFDREFRGDVETIIGKALEKDRTERYRSARDLADDLDRHLGDQPIVARPVSTMVQLRKFARRNKGLVAGIVATIVVLLAGTVVNTSLALVARHERDLKEAQRAEAVWNAYVANVAAAEAALTQQRTDDARAFLEACPAGLRGWEWRHLAARLDRSTLTYRGHAPDRSVKDVLFLPGRDDALVASCSDDGSICIWNARSGDTVHRLARPEHGGHTAWVHDLDVNHAGTALASASHDASVRVWDIDTGTLVRTIDGLPLPVRTVEWSPNDRTLAAGLDDFSLVFIEADDTRSDVLAPTEDPVVSGVADPGAWILVVRWALDAVAAVDGTARRVLARLDAGRILEGRVAVDHARRRAAFGGVDGRVMLWDLERFRLTDSWQAHPSIVRGLAFAPDGRTLATASADRSVRLWDLDSGELRATLLGHDDAVRAVAYRADGALIATGSNDGTARLWDPRAEDVRTLRGHVAKVAAVDFSPDGTRVVSAAGTNVGIDGSVVIWDRATGRALHRLRRTGDDRRLRVSIRR